MYELLHRTGLSRGRVYNGVGSNITADGPGAGNDFIGPFCQDYSSIMFDQNITYDHEFSGIIMDGRALRGAGNTDDSILYPDLDEDEDLSDRASIVGRDTKSARLAACTLKLTHTAPRWHDAHVWEVPLDGGTPTAVQNLAGWLDNDLDDPAGSEGAYWSRLRHYIQVPYYWALYKVPLGPNYEGLADMLVENSAVPVGQLGQMTYGPSGMLTALYGAVYAAQHAYRLYEPTSSIIPVERGYGLMSYSAVFNDDQGNTASAGNQDPDMASFFGDTLDKELRSAVPTSYRRGGLHTTSVHSKRSVKAVPNEVYLWHFGTAPVRIGLIGAGAGGASHLVVGNEGSPYYGPYIHLVYHELTARFSAR